MAKKRGLGKSLDALLAYSDRAIAEAEPETPASQGSSSDALRQLPVGQIHRGKYQPRREMNPEALEELANSIRTQGVIQPIIVRPDGNDFEIIAGERRWRAAQQAGLHEIPAIIREVPDEAAMAIALIENIQRESLNPIEEAAALQRLINEFEMTHQQVAEAVGKSRTTITNLLRLLTLPDAIKSLLERGAIEMGHARAILVLPESLQMQAAETIIAKGLSVREAEELARRLQAGAPQKSSTTRKPIDPDVQKWQDKLSRQLHMRVAIQCNAKGKGKLTIHYRNLRELDELLAQFESEAV